MKRTGLLFLFMGAALIFFSCEKEMIETALADQDVHEDAYLKGANAKWTFTGTCVPLPQDPIDPGTVVLTPEGGTNILGYIAVWYDQTDDYRVSGPSVWLCDYYWEGAPFASDCYAEGVTEILVDDPMNDDTEAAPIGKWIMHYQGNLFFSPDGPRLYGHCDGNVIGVEGVVKGMEAKSVYTIDWDFEGAPLYVVEGEFTKAKGKHHVKVPPGKR